MALDEVCLRGSSIRIIAAHTQRNSPLKRKSPLASKRALIRVQKQSRHPFEFGWALPSAYEGGRVRRTTWRFDEAHIGACSVGSFTAAHPYAFPHKP